MKKNIQQTPNNLKSRLEKKEIPNPFGWKFTTLVLSGGGIRGAAIVGSLVVLEEHGCLNSIKCFSGTSIGAMLCALLCIDYTPKELYEIVLSLDIRELRDIDVFNFFNNFGLDSGKKITEFLENLFRQKNVDVGITFEDLQNKYGKTLITTGTSVNKHKLEVFSAKTHPRCKIIDAIRISTSIPFLYAAPKYNTNYYADGGILDNYPIQSLIGHVEKDDHILGIKLIHTHNFQTGNSDQKNEDIVSRVHINDFNNYAKHLIYTAMDEIQRLRHKLSLYEEKFENMVTIEIKTEGFDSMPIDLSEADKHKLFSFGQHFTACWLEETIEKRRSAHPQNDDEKIENSRLGTN